MKFLLIAIATMTVEINANEILTEVRYRGREPQTNIPCSLWITKSGFENSNNQREDYYMEVSTSFSHDGDAPNAFRVKTVKGKTNVLFEQNGPDQLAVFFTNNDFLTGEPTSYNLKWLHGNHYHTNTCANLKKSN